MIPERIIRSKWLFNHILLFISIIESEISTFKDISYLLCNTRQHRDDDNDQKTIVARQQQSFNNVFKRVYDDNPNFIIYFRSLPVILRNCRDVAMLRSIHARVPHYFTIKLIGLNPPRYYDPSATNTQYHRTLGDCLESKSWVVDNIAASGRIECLVYAINVIKSYSEPSRKTIEMACEYGQLDVLTYLEKKYPTLENKRGFQLAALNGHLHILQHLLEGSSSSFTKYALINVTRSRSVECATLLLNHRDTRLSVLHQDTKHYMSDCMENAIQSGSLEMVELLFNSFTDTECVKADWISFKTLLCAIETGSLEIVKYLHETVGIDIASVMLPSRLEHHLYSKYTKWKDGHTKFIDDVILSNHRNNNNKPNLELIKYLHQKGSKYTVLSWETATKRGYLDTAHYLFDNPTQMTVQLSNEYMVIDTVNENPSLSCLEMVKFLLENVPSTSFQKTNSPPTLDFLESRLFEQLIHGVFATDNVELLQYILEYFGVNIGQVIHHYPIRMKSSGCKVSSRGILPFILNSTKDKLDESFFTLYLLEACIGDQVDVFYYFHQHQLPGFQNPSNLLDHACRHGANDDDITNVLQSAIYSSNLKLVQFIHNQYQPIISQTATEMLLFYSLQYNQLECFQYLLTTCFATQDHKTVIQTIKNNIVSYTMSTDEQQQQQQQQKQQQQILLQDAFNFLDSIDK
ncbi:hypothetical protein DFA_04285 [Cavenderia fasciculata]|uniref:Ankyrin repeat-containing protein n=1 Tax=Cavenderia fasciculata TaxID=261658 RepID=F4PP54_CACFS|nr:uncharacterized protein DFA_04285 [Cavenderia fasciculata]EGG22167.1 hypothetical protein DFA_04285 [Cavenderia fasciculata]|eukprot:XP_004360018.1 hypothetical protein DFA_04285 [Cavenderia fasciculata]